MKKVYNRTKFELVTSKDDHDFLSDRRNVDQIENDCLDDHDTGRKEKSVLNWFIFGLAPILALPLILCVDEAYAKEANCGYVVVVMAVYWITEAIPIAITALLPVLLFPMLGVMSAKEASGAYMSDTCMLSLGALIVSVAIEVWNVHKRLALFVVRKVGTDPKRLLLGVSLVTWSLAIFISNTATTAMMLVTANSLLDMYKKVFGIRNRKKRRHEDGTTVKSLDDTSMTMFTKAMNLTVAYSSSIGGTGSAIGSGSCMIFFATATELFESRGLKMPITFASWLAFGVPLSFMVVVTQWAWLVVRFLRCRGLRTCCSRQQNKNSAEMEALVDEEYRILGPVSYAQKSVFVIFFLMILAWLTRDVGGVGGWGSLFPPKTVTDSTPAIFFSVLMFILPSTSPAVIRLRSKKGFSKYRPLLQWQDVKEKMAWSLYLLLGGGIVLAKGCSASGLSAWLGDQLFIFRGLNKWIILLLICSLTTMTTEIMSNTATATLLQPVIKQLSLSMGINPLFFMYPASICGVYSFMLPAATPPNAVVFSKGLLRVTDMISTGIVLNILAIPLLIFATATWGTAMFDLDTIPPEFISNVTDV